MSKALFQSLEVMGRLGEIGVGVGLIATPEGSGVTKVGGALLVADGVDEIKSIFTGDRTYFEKGVASLTGDEAAKNVVIIKDIAVTAITITASLPNAHKPIGGPSNNKAFSGHSQPWRDGATPNSSYTQIKNGKAFQTAYYNQNGKVIGHVDWKPHGKALSGHGHVFTQPGNVQSGPFAHGKGNYHIPNSDLPVSWQTVPKELNLAPYKTIGQ